MAQIIIESLIVFGTVKLTKKLMKGCGLEHFKQYSLKTDMPVNEHCVGL